VGRHPPQLAAYLAPSRQPLHATDVNGSVQEKVPEVRGHQMVVLAE
jgi:hypothetical protein